MEKKYQNPDTIVPVWGKLACTLLGGLALMLSAGAAVGFNPEA
jgi:hypothetical protein